MPGIGVLDDDTVTACRRVLLDSGAVDLTEQMITEGAQDALAALDSAPGLTDEGRHALTELVAICTDRAT